MQLRREQYIVRLRVLRFAPAWRLLLATVGLVLSEKLLHRVASGGRRVDQVAPWSLVFSLCWCCWVGVGAWSLEVACVCCFFSGWSSVVVFVRSFRTEKWKGAFAL